MPLSAPSPRNASAARRRHPPSLAMRIPRVARAFAAPIAAAVMLSALAGCGAPGLPDARHPITPQPITDLAARQQGDAVILNFTLPANSTDQKALAAPPTVEIYRGTLIPGSALPRNPSFHLANTIPGDVTKNYVIAGRFQFQVPLAAAEVSSSPGEQEIFQVRTIALRGGPSAPSADLVLRVYPPPAAISDLRAAVTEPAIVLNWTPPDRTSSGAALPAAPAFRIYRVEVPMSPPSAKAAGAVAPGAPPSVAPPGAPPSGGAPVAAALAVTPPPNSAPPNLAALLQLLAPLPAAAPPSAAQAQASPATPAEYRDTAFSFGTAYLYSVRSVISYGADQVESDDSNLITVNARDIFPPAAPQPLVGVLTPAANGMPPYVELTWGINSESDLAGYIVYRSDAADTPGQRMNPEVLPAPTYRDESAQPGRRYFYHVTAVDQAGNESASSTVVDVALP
jgi:hypothetical protein